MYKRQTLNSFVGRKLDDGQTILPTILYPTRKKVDSINTTSLNKLEGNYRCFDYKYCTQQDLTLSKEQLSMASLWSNDQIEHEKKYMSENINFDNQVKLKVGAQVMCIANIDLEGENPICNGSRGIIKDFDSNGYPIVLFKNGSERKIGYHIWQSELIPSIGVKQIPLILAWAITIHKSQGASLDLAEIDIGNQIFECGQTYVALSRVTSLDGLYLKSFNPSKIMINRKVIEFYETLGKN